MQRQKRQRATIGIATIARMVAYMVAPAALVPALMINLDWSQPWNAPWNLAAAGSIIGSALFIEVAVGKPSWLRTPLFLVIGLAMLGNNVLGAFSNASHKSDHRSDHRKGAMVAAKTQWSQRSQWSQGRTEAATIAGEKSPDTYELEVQAAIAKDARRWQATDECDPQHISAGPSREFCNGIANLKAKKAAATRRDQLDDKIAKLDARTEGAVGVPTSADPYADNLAAFLASIGVNVGEEVKAAFTSQRNFINSVMLELLATFGPTAWLLAVSGVIAAFSRAPPPVPLTPQDTKPARKREPAPITEAVEAPPVPMDDPFHRFVAERLEDCNGVRMKADEPWQMWLAWCSERKIDPGSQKAFGGKMKTRFAWEPNNNRPRYLNVRAKQIGPVLRVVGGRKE